MAHKCRFRRNTLLEMGDMRVVVSTVGLMEDNTGPSGFGTIGYGRYYETMAFLAFHNQDRWWDADVEGQVAFTSPWSIEEVDADDRANDMHERVVDEIAGMMKAGLIVVNWCGGSGEKGDTVGVVGRDDTVDALKERLSRLLDDDGEGGEG